MYVCLFILVCTVCMYVCTVCMYVGLINLFNECLRNGSHPWILVIIAVHLSDESKKSKTSMKTPVSRISWFDS